jgi:hypothetical protein
MERTIFSLSDEEYEKLLKAMEAHEGWEEGYEEFNEIKKIIGVRMNKKRVISEYLIKDLQRKQWCLKDVVIAMAEEGHLHATVVHAKKGVYTQVNSKIGNGSTHRPKFIPNPTCKSLPKNRFWI